MAPLVFVVHLVATCWMAGLIWLVQVVHYPLFAHVGAEAFPAFHALHVRWISPVGPIRLDIAHPFDDEDNSWRLHFAIGPEF